MTKRQRQLQHHERKREQKYECEEEKKSGRYFTCSILFNFYKLNVNSAAANKQQKNLRKKPNILMFRLFN